MRLAGKTALITGAGSGIGKFTAQLFAREGAGVAVVDLNGAAAEATAAEIRSAGGAAIAVPADVARAEDAERMIGAAVEAFGRLDILFNNAGLAQAFTPTEETTVETWDRIYAVNVRGVFLGCKYAIPVMKRQGRGVILNTASTAGIRPRPGLLAYNSSKGAVITLTKGLALELAPFGIRVVAICPVATDTPMLAQFIGEQDYEEGRRRFIASIPLGRLNTPADIGYAALYLASDEAAMVTGTALEVDGGRDL